MTTLREFSSAVVRVELEPQSLDPRGRLVAGAEGEWEEAAVRIWEPRMYQVPVSSIRVSEGGASSSVSDLAVQCRSELVAVSTRGGGISLFNWKGRRVNGIRYQEGMMGQRVGPVRALAWHPHRLLLAAATSDHLVALYGPTS